MRPGTPGRSVTSVGPVRDVREPATSRLPSGDDGNAIVEFLGVSLLLLVPVVYLVLVLATLQAGAFAVDGAAREAARAFVTADDDARAYSLATAAVGLALADQGLDPDQAGGSLELSCSDEPCRTPGGIVTAAVEVAVPLPGVPGWLQDAVPLSVPVSATATASIDAHAAGD